jgi:hypothetical protein
MNKNQVPTTASGPRSPVASAIARALCLALASAGIMAGTTPLEAASSTPPNNMSYQGFLVDANGTPLAPSLPVNYPIVFRIYDASQGGHLLWTEQQTVTVQKGNFSVVLGEGSGVPGEVRPNLAEVFTGTSASDRYISITVTVNGTPNEILPRLRLLPGAYSFLAANANALVKADGVPVVNYNNSRVEVNGPLSASSFAGNGAQLTGFTSGQIPNLDASKITSGVLNQLRIPDVFDSNKSFRGSVTVGGSMTPLARLELQAGANNDGGSDEKAIAFSYRSGGYRHWIRSRHNGGLGGYGNALDFYVNNSSQAGGSSAPGVGSLLALTLDSGKVGIGTTSPARPLHISGTDNVLARLDSSNASGTWLSLGNSSSGGRYWQMVSGGSGNGAGAGKLFFHRGSTDNLTEGDPVLTLQNDGRVGIGTFSPANGFHVQGESRIARFESSALDGSWLSVKNTSTGGDIWSLIATGKGNGEGAGHLLLARGEGASGGVKVTFRSDGRVGIGTTAPVAPLEVKGSGVVSKSYGFLNVNGGTGTSSGANGYSIIAENRIAASEFNATSDARIKDIQGASNTAKDLATIQQLKVTDYKSIDYVTEGKGLKKGFIAQEVERIIPEAVTQSRRFVPDIYSLASSSEFDAKNKTLTVSMAKPHQLKAGDRVQIITEDSRLQFDVASTPSPESFVVARCEAKPSQVFVFGKEVSDFRTLNYDRIFTTGIGAIQELAQQVKSLKEQQSAMQAKVAKLEAMQGEFAELKAAVRQLAADAGKSKDLSVAQLPR